MGGYDSTREENQGGLRGLKGAKKNNIIVISSKVLNLV
jgi:hypothetical protein